MKIIITESQYNLLIENKKYQFLIDEIKKNNWESASKMVNGIENLIELLNIKTPKDYLNLFNDLNVVLSEENSNLILFRYKRGYNIMLYNKNTNIVYISNYKIWSFLEQNFGLKNFKIKEIIKSWLSEVYNLRGVTIKELRQLGIDMIV